MKKILMLVLIGILLSSVAFATLTRVISDTEVNTGSTFTVTYEVEGVTAPYFYSIKDVMSGGCKVDGASLIVTTLTSPQTATGSITVTAPTTSATCQFVGDSKLGSADLVDFPSASVKVGEGGPINGDEGIGLITVLLIAGGALVFFMFMRKK